MFVRVGNPIRAKAGVQMDCAFGGLRWEGCGARRHWMPCRGTAWQI